MAYDIRLAKIVSGDTVIGKFDATTEGINDPAILQTVPTGQGVQMMILPFGYPFDTEFSGRIAKEHIIFVYNTCPEEIQTKYLEASSNLTLSSGGLGGLDLKGAKPAPAGLIRK